MASVTCGRSLTAEDRDQRRNPTLVSFLYHIRHVINPSNSFKISNPFLSCNGLNMICNRDVWALSCQLLVNICPHFRNLLSILFTTYVRLQWKIKSWSTKVYTANVKRNSLRMHRVTQAEVNSNYAVGQKSCHSSLTRLWQILTNFQYSFAVYEIRAPDCSFHSGEFSQVK